jgi:osmoprotectant transport system permease protein
MDSSLMYQAVRDSQVDVISAFSTDGRIAAFDIQLVEDDRGVIPPYDAIILAGARVANEMPEVLTALGKLVGRISESRMQRLNLRVDQEGETPKAVAEEFLGELRRGDSRPRPQGPGRGQQ